MRSELKVADIFRRHGPAYRLTHDGHLGRVERRVMSAIELCRTAALGGHVEACEDCAHTRVADNSYRNRHCPKCQGAARDQWLAARQADLLPVRYFHVVFTVPAEVAAIAYQNKALVYGILFDAVAETLKVVAANPKHLGGELGFIATLDHLSDASAFADLVRAQRKKRWVVYAKPPFGSPEHVLAYLGRYTHRVAIGNSRLVSADDTSVSFRWRDYANASAPRLMTLDGHEFIRRFLLRSLPDGFHRIRHYGFLANGCRRTRLATIRQLLPGVRAAPVEPVATAILARSGRFDPTVCPCCGGALRVTAALPRWPTGRSRPCPDTS
jgi:hypothetical protein